MRHIIHLWPAPLYNIFPRYLIKSTIFEKKGLPNTKCVFRVSVHLLSEIFVIPRRTEQDVIKMCIGLPVRCSLLLSDCNKI